MAIELKIKQAIRRKKGGWSCIGCVGLDSDNKCFQASQQAQRQRLSPCTKGVVYLEDVE